jgi:mono/diheme cytochrome c family protein
MSGFLNWFKEYYRFAMLLAHRCLGSLKKDWRKHAVALFLFLTAAMMATALLSRAYQFWDVGSNSWVDRLKGNGWEFQRGAATIAQDPFGDRVSTVRYLVQGWTPADSMWFYTTTQGSDLLPYDFFMALEKANASGPFRSDENLDYYRYLPQKASLSNPDALPVGFAKDRYKGKDYLGFTCAACHTAQLNYKGIGIRIDGGPAGTDMDSFLQALATALWAARTNDVIRARFVAEVMHRGHYASEDDVLQDLQKYAQRLSMYNIVNHSETPYGYSRLDAFGRIYNRVLEHIITQRELKEQLNLTVGDLVKAGTLTQDDVDSIERQQRGGGVLSDNERDHLVLRLSQVLPLKAQLKMSEKIFNRPDAPVSYPFLWDIPQHDYVQWNGLGANAGLGPIGRNAGEVIGVFATLDWEEAPGISLFSFIGGQGFKATHISFKSSINVHNLRLIENRLQSLQSPQWPKDIFPPIDPNRSARGERLFTTYCEGCHARVKRDDPKRRIVAHMSRLSDIGTDPQMASNAAKYAGLSGILRNQYVHAGPGDVLINERAPVAALLTKATLNVVATPEDKTVLRRVYQWVYELAAALFSNDIKTSLKQGNYDPDTSAEPYSSLYSYKARSLNGIWATAPYLHNGSVPTLYDLLLPKKREGDEKGGEYRPDQFQVGSREFDPEKVGLNSSGHNGFTFDTRRRGNSNAGHSYGTGLDKEQRLDLLEFLKTL